jgi:hypothetical protein
VVWVDLDPAYRSLRKHYVLSPTSCTSSPPLPFFYRISLPPSLPILPSWNSLLQLSFGRLLSLSDSCYLWTHCIRLVAPCRFTRLSQQTKHSTSLCQSSSFKPYYTLCVTLRVLSQSQLHCGLRELGLFSIDHRLGLCWHLKNPSLPVL